MEAISNSVANKQYKATDIKQTYSVSSGNEHLDTGGNNPNFYNTETFSDFFSIASAKSYIPMNYCVFEHIIRSSDLTDIEKLYYILADSLALINSNNGKRRAIALPAVKWASYLNCSKSQIFSLQQTLAEKGYFIVLKEQNKFSQNKRNLITPTLPDKVFDDLNNSASCQTGKFYFYNPTHECKRSYLDKTKLFIRLNYQLLQLITSTSDLSNLQKVIWLDLFGICSKSQKEDFIVSYAELSERYSRSSKYLSKIFISMQNSCFIRVEHFYSKKEIHDNERMDKSLWKIELTLPDNLLEIIAKIPDRTRVCNNDAINHSGDFACADPEFSKLRPLLNKYSKTNIKEDRSSKSQFLKKSNSSKSVKSKSNFLKDCLNSKKTKKESLLQETTEISLKENSKQCQIQEDASAQSKNKIFNSKPKQLKDFYPLTEEDCQFLCISSNRKFSSISMNEILLDMSKRLEDRLFYSKKVFLLYMSKVFSNEMRDENKINNENFKIRNNLTEEDINLRKYNKYLTEIENNLQVSPEYQLKKRLAAIFNAEKSYNLLKSYKKIRITDGVFNLYLSKYVYLTERDKETIFNQVKSIYCNIYSDDIEIKSLNIIMPDKSEEEIEKQNDTTKVDTNILPDGIWCKVRCELMSLYGENGKNIDKHWFSKLSAIVEEETNIIKLEAPNSFVKDWISQNYLERIELVIKNNQYKMVFC